MTQYGVESHTDLLRRTEKRLQSLERRPQGSTFWRGEYQVAKCYDKGSIVTQGDYLLIAKRYTCSDPVTDGVVNQADWDLLTQSPTVVPGVIPNPTPAAGWALIGMDSWVSGDVAWMRVQVENTGSTITISNPRPGQIGDTTIFTVDSDWLPEMDVDAHWQTGYTSGGGTLTGTGEWKLRDGGEGSEIRTGEDVQVTIGPYLVAGGGGGAAFGEASSLAGGVLELPQERIYHNTAKTIALSGSDQPLDTPLTLNYTNPYSFPLIVRVVYQPHFYSYASGTTYMRVVMNGATQQPGDVNNTSRKQYNGPSSTFFDEIYVEGIFTVPAKATVEFEVTGRDTGTVSPTVNYGSMQAQALGVAGNGSVGQGAVWGRARRTSNQTITRGTGDQHIDFTDGTVEGGLTWDADGLVIPEDGVYVAVLAVNAPFNQSGGGTNGHFTLTANGFYSSWQDTNTPDANHRGTFVTVPHPIPLSAGHRVYGIINPMSSTGTQITIESADLFVFRVGDTDLPRREYATTVTTDAGTGLATVTYPANLFVDPPVVSVTPRSAVAPGGAPLRLAYLRTGDTKDGCEVGAMDGNGNALSLEVHVHAVAAG